MRAPTPSSCGRPMRRRRGPAIPAARSCSANGSEAKSRSLPLSLRPFLGCRFLAPHRHLDYSSLIGTAPKRGVPMNMQLRPGAGVARPRQSRGAGSIGVELHALELAVRMRRNRRTAWSRRLVREQTLTVDDLIWPVFVIEGKTGSQPIASMPGVSRLTIDALLAEVEEAVKLGIPAIALFPNIDAALRDEDGSQSLRPDSLVCRAISAVKARFPEIGVMTDVALDPYTSHGHDGLMRGDEIINDETVAVLVRQALVQAQAGCDIISPSDMMDGRVGAI